MYLPMNRLFLYVTVMMLGLAITLSSFVPEPNSSLANDVLEETNNFRKSKGKSELEMKSELNAIAEQHSINMAKGKVAFGHAGFDKRNAMAVSSVRSISSFAENVAFGAPTAKEVVIMWKNSPGHRTNMLGSYKYIGIGVAKDKNGRLYYTQVFAG